MRIQRSSELGKTNTVLRIKGPLGYLQSYLRVQRKAECSGRQQAQWVMGTREIEKEATVRRRRNLLRTWKGRFLAVAEKHPRPVGESLGWAERI